MQEDPTGLQCSKFERMNEKSLGGFFFTDVKRNH